jgi:hypothetical protein
MSLGSQREDRSDGIAAAGVERRTPFPLIQLTKNVMQFTVCGEAGSAGPAPKGHGRWLLC